MEYLGTHFNRKVYWVDYDKIADSRNLPSSDWILFVIANEAFEEATFKKVSRTFIDNGLLEFVSHGQKGELLHTYFDDAMVDLEINHDYSVIDINTNGTNSNDIANAFWECFYSTVLPIETNFENLSIICCDLNGKDQREALKLCIEKFNNNWIPKD